MCEATTQTLARWRKTGPSPKSFPEDTKEKQQQWICNMLHYVFPDYNEKAQGAVSLCDVSQCIWVLADRGIFTKVFLDWDEKYFGPCLEAFGDIYDNASVNGQNMMSSILLHFMVKECEFAPVPEIVFYGGTGDAFIPIVQNGMIFKDGLSAIHGEYAHTLQWAILGWANRRGYINLTNSVVNIYKASVDTRRSSKEKYKQEFGDNKKILIWDVLCDTFDVRGKEHEDYQHNIFSESFRSPAYLTKVLMSQDLQYTACGLLMQHRHARKHLFAYRDQDAGLKDMQAYSKHLAQTRLKDTDDKGQVAYRSAYMDISRQTKKKITTTSVTPAGDVATQIQAPGNRVNYNHWPAWDTNLTNAH